MAIGKVLDKAQNAVVIGNGGSDLHRCNDFQCLAEEGGEVVCSLNQGTGTQAGGVEQGCGEGGGNKDTGQWKGEQVRHYEIFRECPEPQAGERPCRELA